jgi:hypothetical protein
MLNESLYAVWVYAAERTGITLPGADVLVFCASLGTLALAAKFHPPALRGLLGSVLGANLRPLPLSGRLGPRLAAILPTLATFVRGFAVGWGLRTLLSALGAAFKRRWAQLPGVCWRPAGITLGAAIGSMAALYQALTQLLGHLRGGRPLGAAATFAAAFVAGLPFAHPRVRNLMAVCYLAAKALEAAVRMLHLRGLVPTVPHATFIVFTLSVIVNMHFAVFHPHVLEPSYWSFLKTMTNGLYDALDRRAFARLGWSAPRYLDAAPPAARE